MSFPARVLFAGLLVLPIALPVSAAPLPADVQPVISKVRAAAAKRDFAALRPLMVKEFTFSFGDDRDADAAIAYWKSDKNSLKDLVAVLDKGCRATAKNAVECKGNGSTGYRAGFKKTSQGWLMEWAVGGD